jgi:hypothetical protein
MTSMRVHQVSSTAAAVLLALQKLSRPQLDDAVRAHREKHSSRIATVIGIANAGVIYSDDPDWSPDAQDALADLCVIPWVLIHELLGNVPAGTKDDFLRSGGQQ